ncbi:MAG TPA: FAD-dependent oxidoreductase [Chloroflexia bacterium]|nr:FAD-dependent oxidoreductase [Chloroflexia bacterium]
MPHYTYLIIGGGMTAAAAVAGIREIDPGGSIGLISREADPPYNRPPLSKALWKGDPLASIWRETPDQNVTMYLSRTAQALDPQNRRVTDDQGQEYTYDKLLLATGGTPRRLPFGDDKIIYFRTLADYTQLRQQSAQHQAFVVLGGGFIGSEIAAALAMNGNKVTMVFPDADLGVKVFPPGLARFLTGYFGEKGIEVLNNALPVDLKTQNGQLVLQTRDVITAREDAILVDGAVAGLGIIPDIELALAGGLEVENGIVVDASFRTSHPDIYAAGDVAAIYNSQLGRYRRVEHEDNANTMGRLAGRAMAGALETYDTYLPSFYSDLFDLGYEAVGELDSRLEIVEDWQEPYREGVVYYLQNGRVRGVLLWNVWGQVETARELIGQGGPFQAADLKGRITSQ